MSLGIAVATFTAQNFGARKYARIREGAKKCSFVAVGMSLAGCLAMVLTGRWLLSLFGIGLNEPDVVREAVLYLNTTSLFYFMLGLLFIFRNLLQGMGRNIMPTAAAGAEVVVRIVATFTFVNWWGFWGVCIVNPVAWTGAVAMLVIGYYQAVRDFRRHIPPTYESVILNYDAQAKFGAPMENVPVASVRLTASPEVRSGDKESIRIL
ncbi:MAG: hypothetical protein LUE17_09370 [Planctomycetaceae bacterium]|nr:hypothetical protein [Planctomycetaceae bacterium]